MPTVVTALTKCDVNSSFLSLLIVHLRMHSLYVDPFRWQEDPETEARQPRDGGRMVGMTVERLPLRVIQSAIDGLWRVT